MMHRCRGNSPSRSFFSFFSFFFFFVLMCYMRAQLLCCCLAGPSRMLKSSGQKPSTCAPLHQAGWSYPCNILQDKDTTRKRLFVFLLIFFVLGVTCRSRQVLWPHPEKLPHCSALHRICFWRTNYLSSRLAGRKRLQVCSGSLVMSVLLPLLLICFSSQLSKRQQQ